jgi:hypothetical protein
LRIHVDVAVDFVAFRDPNGLAHEPSADHRFGFLTRRQPVGISPWCGSKEARAANI